MAPKPSFRVPTRSFLKAALVVSLGLPAITAAAPVTYPGDTFTLRQDASGAIWREDFVMPKERPAPEPAPQPEAITPPAKPAPVVGPNGKTFNCRISAYYSPQKNQGRYATGSYAGDIRLNGRGTNGASGRQVFPGMIAAPKHIAFGTKIDVPGYGIGEVQDRGGAIKGNRLDLYFGKGEAALNAALTFGIRNTTCTIL